MKASTTTVLGTAVALAASVFAIVAFADGGRKSTAVVSQAGKIEQGRYIVHQLGLCIDCHSPRNERGEFLEGKHLTGSPLAFKPIVEMPFMPVAPRLAGLPAGYTSENLVHFLMTGERPNGLPPVLPPMPPYRMTREDAEATVTYLRALPGGLE